MDTRGQGSDWGPGDTADPHGSEPSHPGFTTRGIRSPEGHYYRRVFTDAVLAVDLVRAHPQVDPARVVVAGGSQGGAIAIATAAPADGVAGVLADVPFWCDVPRGVQVASEGPYLEVAGYLDAHPDHEADVWRTVSYLDVTVLAPLVGVPARVSVALMDPVCPPSTVFAVSKALGGECELVVYPYGGHGSAWRSHDVAAQLTWLHRLWRS